MFLTNRANASTLISNQLNANSARAAVPNSWLSAGASRATFSIWFRNHNWLSTNPGCDSKIAIASLTPGSALPRSESRGASSALRLNLPLCLFFFIGMLTNKSGLAQAPFSAQRIMTIFVGSGFRRRGAIQPTRPRSHSPVARHSEHF